MTTHVLKTWPEYFDAINNGEKTFDIRVNDRGFSSGDLVTFVDYNPETKKYSGREITKKIAFMVDGALGFNGVEYVPKGICVMSLKKAI